MVGGGDTAPVCIRPRLWVGAGEVTDSMFDSGVAGSMLAGCWMHVWDSGRGMSEVGRRRVSGYPTGT